MSLPPGFPWWPSDTVTGNIMSKPVIRDKHMTRIAAALMIFIVTAVVIMFVGMNLHDVKRSAEGNVRTSEAL